MTFSAIVRFGAFPDQGGLTIPDNPNQMRAKTLRSVFVQCTSNVGLMLFNGFRKTTGLAGIGGLLERKTPSLEVLA